MTTTSSSSLPGGGDDTFKNQEDNLLQKSLRDVVDNMKVHGASRATMFTLLSQSILNDCISPEHGAYLAKFAHLNVRLVQQSPREVVAPDDWKELTPGGDRLCVFKLPVKFWDDFSEEWYPSMPLIPGQMINVFFQPVQIREQKWSQDDDDDGKSHHLMIETNTPEVMKMAHDTPVYKGWYQKPVFSFAAESFYKEPMFEPLTIASACENAQAPAYIHHALLVEALLVNNPASLPGIRPETVKIVMDLRRAQRERDDAWSKLLATYKTYYDDHHGRLTPEQKKIEQKLYKAYNALAELPLKHGSEERWQSFIGANKLMVALITEDDSIRQSIEATIFDLIAKIRGPIQEQLIGAYDKLAKVKEKCKQQLKKQAEGDNFVVGEYKNENVLGKHPGSDESKYYISCCMSQRLVLKNQPDPNKKAPDGQPIYNVSLRNNLVRHLAQVSVQITHQAWQEMYGIIAATVPEKNGSDSKISSSSDDISATQSQSSNTE